MTPEDFYAQYMPYAQSVSQRTGLDPRLVLAQAALETGYGKSAPNSNFFGIKSHGRPGGQTLQTSELEGGRMVGQPASFRGYESPAQSFQDYGEFIMSNPRYEGVRSANGLNEQIVAMANSGYATDPQYGAKLASIATRFNPDSPAIIGADAMRAIGRQPMQGRASTQGAAPMMQEEQQPRGLLGTLGIQKMQEGAPGETGQRFYERDTFKDTAATLAQAFAGLTDNPALQKAASDVAGQRTEAKARNKTVEYLRANGREDLADMIEAGQISGKDAAGVMLAKPEVTKGVAVGDRIVNPITGEVIYEGAPTLDQDKVLAARKEFTSLPVVKAFSDQTTAYGRVISSVQDPSPAGDLALIFNYMKVLDPGSVVREGEFATAQNAGSVDDRTRGLYNRIMSGERLSEAQRADFADRATRLYSGAEQQYQDISEQYGAFARSAGLPPEQVIPNFGFTGDRYEKPLSMTPPPAPAGVDAATWPSVWAEMTDEERAAYQ